MMDRSPRIGVAVIVRHRGRVLLGLRRGSHGNGSWSFPGGHLEWNESLGACARREVREETGIKVKNLRIATFTNDRFRRERKHYVTLYLMADFAGGRVARREPHRSDGWQWFRWDRFPSNLFLPLRNLRKQRFDPFKASSL